MIFKDLYQWITDYVASYHEKYNQIAIWRKPLLISAVADSRFHSLKQITVPDHALPRDLLPGARSLLVWFIPFKHHIQLDNTDGRYPSLSWGRAYASTNEMIGRVGSSMKRVIENAGGEAALTPATHNFDKERLISLWSHKHLGHLAGLGRYGVNCQLITPSGCSGRLGSLVTDLDLGDHPLVTADEICLVKAGKKCGKCMKSCPVNALSESGVDKPACYSRLRTNYHRLMEPDGLPATTDVCAKCQVGMPCSLKAPIPVNEK